MSFGSPVYSSMYIITLGLVWSLLLWKCLATVVLLLCLMWKMSPWNRSMILFLVCPHTIYGTSCILKNTLACAFGNCIVGCIVVPSFYLPWVGDFIFTFSYSVVHRVSSPPLMMFHSAKLLHLNFILQPLGITFSWEHQKF